MQPAARTASPSTREQAAARSATCRSRCPRAAAPLMESGSRRTSPRPAACDRFDHLRGRRIVGDLPECLHDAARRAIQDSRDGDERRWRSQSAVCGQATCSSITWRSRARPAPPQASRSSSASRVARRRGLGPRERQSAPTFATRAWSSPPALRARRELIESRGAPLFIGSASPLRASLCGLLLHPFHPRSRSPCPPLSTSSQRVVQAAPRVEA